jgi:hypothetical protein
VEEQVRGDDLTARYKITLPPGAGSLLPSLSSAYTDLSRWMHSRTGSPEDYTTTRKAVCKHLRLLVELERE